MKMIVGLGNPGEGHARNRHNVGFVVIDRLAGEAADWEAKFDALILKKGKTLLVKPQTFMNRSGESVARVANFYKVGSADIVVVHDDLDIRLGGYKIQTGVGPKVHNGINSVEAALGTKDFGRVRVGVDNRGVGGDGRTAGDEYVLANFSDEEVVTLNGVIEQIVREIVIE